jgi:hypothetical protein
MFAKTVLAFMSQCVRSLYKKNINNPNKAGMIEIANSSLYARVYPNFLAEGTNELPMLNQPYPSLCEYQILPKFFVSAFAYHYVSGSGTDTLSNPVNARAQNTTHEPQRCSAIL